MEFKMEFNDLRVFGPNYMLHLKMNIKDVI
jgi:hypothetical protein